MEDLDLQSCNEHTLDRHIEIHEAGHAIAAIDNGIPFSHIAMYQETGDPNAAGGPYVTAAEVVMVNTDPVTYVAPDPQRALRFLLAGHCAETALLGHGMPDAEKGDIKAWRVGVGLPTDAPVTEAELDSRAGTSFRRIVEQAEAWAQANTTRITRLAEHLAVLPRPSQMSYRDVVAFMATT